MVPKPMSIALKMSSAFGEANPSSFTEKEPIMGVRNLLCLGVPHPHFDITKLTIFCVLVSAKLNLGSETLLSQKIITTSLRDGMQSLTKLASALYRAFRVRTIKSHDLLLGTGS